MPLLMVQNKLGPGMNTENGRIPKVKTHRPMKELACIIIQINICHIDAIDRLTLWRESSRVE